MAIVSEPCASPALAVVTAKFSSASFGSAPADCQLWVEQCVIWPIVDTNLPNPSCMQAVLTFHTDLRLSTQSSPPPKL
jgi:hypothetical protein